MKAVYIHIPFCQKICSYCDFSKMYYNSTWVDKYLTALKTEIDLNYKGEKVDTIYIGGGTPSSLSEIELERLFSILKNIKTNDIYEFTIECNVESLSEKKIKIFKKNGINRVSIGVQTFNAKYLKYLNRDHSEKQIIECINHLKNNDIANINIDLIYALKGQTIDELNNDINMFLSLDIPHISTYSLLIEQNTKLYIEKEENIDEDLDSDMYELICDRLKENYVHYETSNFGKQGYFSKHNLTYWNNEEYYGFGLGASGYVNSVRYDNTKSLNDYTSHKFRLNETVLTKNEKIENEFILGFRKLEGINIKNFNAKYNIDINNIKIVNSLLEQKKIVSDGEYIRISPEYIYLSNDILIEFLGENYEETI